MAKINESRDEKEFTKTEKRELEEQTKSQQRGGDVSEQVYRTRRREHRRSEDKEYKEEIKNEKEPEKNIDKKIDEKKLEKELAGKRKAAEISAVEHDIRDIAMGQIYGVPGANIDYDEVEKMAKNNIRDGAELASESLDNDGLMSPEEVIKMYVEKGDAPEKVAKLNQDYDMEVVAKAFVDVLKESHKNDAPALGRVYDMLHMDDFRYENVLENIRDRDPWADSALDALDAELGIERDRF